jgi:hypothetical protein
MKQWKNPKQKLIGISTISFFVCLVAWSLSSPISSAPDSDFHMSNIWCAWGVKPEICENQKVGSTGATADVSYFVQICEGRPITEWRNCDPTEEHPPMQTLRTSDGSAKNLYYVFMRIFASTNVPLSIVAIRLFSCFLASALLFGILSLARGRLLVGVVSSVTFILVPNTLVFIPMATSKSWALIGSLFGWAFLAICVDSDRNYRDRLISAVFYGFCVLLVVSTRIDATVFLLFSSFIILIRAANFGNLLRGSKRILFYLFSIFVLIASTRIPRVGSYLTQLELQGHGSVLNSILFVFNQTVESIASCFGYWVPQSGAGPGSTGIIGVSLAALVIGVSLQKQEKAHLLQTSLVLIFVSAIIYWGNVVMGPRVPGTYILSIVAFLIGITVMNASIGPDFMIAKKSRYFVIATISICHWMNLDGRIYGYLFYAQPGNIYSPWLTPVLAPVSILLLGAIGLTTFLSSSWKLVDSELFAQSISGNNS